MEKQKKTELTPDFEAIAYELADKIGPLLVRLRHTSDWMGTLRNRETGENYTWEECLARTIEKIPGLSVDRRYLEAKNLPAKERRKRYREPDLEKQAKKGEAA